jgi:predicted ATPase
VTGPGGVGKTRLMLEAADRAAHAFRDGAWFVDLSRVVAGRMVDEVVAGFLGLRLPPEAVPREALFDYLRDKRVLLALDNCEQVVQACAELACALLRGCPGLTLLATSREVLGLSGEHVLRVPPLAPAAAVELFAERAHEACGEEALDAACEPVVAELCRALDGLPLAIEMAASRARCLPPRQVMQLVAAPGGGLANGDRTAPARHRSLDAVIEWSLALLPPDERAFLERLAVLPESWDLEQAADIEPDAVVLLAGLVDKSLVCADMTAHPARYRLLRGTRRYLLRRFSPQSGGLETARERPAVEPGGEVLHHARPELREHRVVHEAQVRRQHDVVTAG